MLLSLYPLVSSASSASLTVQPGVFTITGQDAILTLGSTLTIDTGTYSQHPVNCQMVRNYPERRLARKEYLPREWLR